MDVQEGQITELQISSEFNNTILLSFCLRSFEGSHHVRSFFFPCLTGVVGLSSYYEQRYNETSVKCFLFPFFFFSFLTSLE